MRILIFIASLFFSFQGFSQEERVKVYPFKSAIIEYKYEAAFSGTHIKYIEDYGYKQADYFQQKTNGEVSKNEIIILLGEKGYAINREDSTVAVGRNSAYTYYLQNQDKSGVDVSEAIIKNAFGYQLKGIQEYLNKECKVWKSGKSTLLTWNGLELKSEINFFMMMVEKATKVKIDKKIPAKFFEIPKGFTYTATDVYQGFSGLELNFDTLSNINNESKTNIKVEFSSTSLGGSNNFKYYKASGQEVELRGANSYNKVDQMLIKSQQNQLTSTSVIIPTYGTIIYQTISGNYGKMQLVSVEEGSYLIRYAVFDNDGFIKEHSDGESSFLGEDFEIIYNEKNNKLELVPKNTARCFVLGEF